MHRAGHQRDHRATHHDPAHRPPHPEERRFAPHRGIERIGTLLHEPPHRVAACAVRADVLRGVESLLDAAVEPSERAQFVRRLGDGPLAEQEHQPERDGDVDEHAETDAPVEHADDDDHAEDQQHRTECLRHDARQEVRHRGHVTVDALDQLPRRVSAMELVIETEDVTGHVDAQLIGRPPGADRGRAHHDDLHHLTDDHDREEAECERSQLGGVGPFGRAIHDPPDHERPRQEEQRADADDQRERGPSARMGAQQTHESARILRRGRRHIPHRPRSITRWATGFQRPEHRHARHRPRVAGFAAMAAFRVTYATLSADDESLQASYTEASAAVRAEFGATHPLWIGDDERFGDTFTTVSPVDTSVEIGHFTIADADDVDDAVERRTCGAARVGGDAVAGALRHPRPRRRPDLRTIGRRRCRARRGRTARAGWKRSARSRRPPT